MSLNYGFGVYNTYKKLLRTFDSYYAALEFIKSLKNVSYLDVLYLFSDKPVNVIVTKCLYIQRFLESGGGVSQVGKKYYFKKDCF